MQSFFEGFGDVKLPSGLCACTKWRSPAHRPIITPEGGVSSVHWGKVCRGPGKTRFSLRITEPGIEYKHPTVHHAAEVELDLYTAPNGGGEVDHTWRLHKSRHLGYFKSVAAAKRYAEAAAQRACQKVSGK